MTDEIRLISLELKNYRQFYGDQSVDFSSREEGFTTLLGKNGEGKSNLLNAINWCFYKNEPHGKKANNVGVPILNLKYITEIKDGHTARTSVKILLQKGNEQYRISRVLTVLKHTIEYDELPGGIKVMRITKFADDKVPTGCEILQEDSNFEISKKGEHDSDFHDIKKIEKIDPKTKLEQILPEQLSSFFLLDGEFLEGFWGNPERIEQGIEQISQLHLLSSAKKYVSALQIPTKGFGQETDTLSKKCQLLSWFEQSLDEDGNEAFSEEERWKSDPNEESEYYHKSGTPRITDLKHDITKMENRLKSISREIANVNVANVKVLKEQYDGLNKKFLKEKGTRSEAEKNYRNNLVAKSPFLFLKVAIEKSTDIVQRHQKKGELPNETKKTFTSDLLEQNKCICHTDLTSHTTDGKETNQFRSRVEEVRDAAAGDEDLDTAVRMRYFFKHKLIDDYDNFLKTTFIDPRKAFSDSEIALNDLNQELKGIISKLGGAGDVKTTQLINEHDYLLEQINDAKNKISAMDLKVSSNQSELTSLQIKINKIMEKNISGQKLFHELKIWEKTMIHLNKIYDELKDEIRVGVQEKTWEIFIGLLDNPNEFTKFIIQPNYSVILLDQYSSNKIIDISAGQSLLLTLAFVAALREPTGYKFPLVIDSPLGKIDGSIRYNIGNALPDYLKGEQITFLATDTEYVAKIPLDPEEPERETLPFGVLLEKKIPVKLFRIKKGDDGNSTISPVKLGFNESKQEWEVNHNV